MKLRIKLICLKLINQTVIDFSLVKEQMTDFVNVSRAFPA